jgi:hypothetical protein
LTGTPDTRAVSVKARPSARGHLAFLHGLQHGGLGLGRGAVDFVGEQEIRENRPRHELQLAGARHRVVLDDLGAGDVRRHQIRCELDAFETQIQRLRE